jgi:hypothetical protein
MLLRAELLGAGDAALVPSFPGLALLDWSVSGGVGMTNCVPLRLRGFLEGDASSCAGRFRFCGETGEETMSSMGSYIRVQPR